MPTKIDLIEASDLRSSIETDDLILGIANDLSTEIRFTFSTLQNALSGSSLFNEENTSNTATTISTNMYHTGSFGVGDFSGSTIGTKFKVLGDASFKGSASSGTGIQFIGVAAGLGNTGSYNVGFGDYVLDNSSAGGTNTAIGYNALTGLALGDGNTVVGANAGINLSGASSDNNVIIGNSAGNLQLDGVTASTGFLNSVLIGSSVKTLGDTDDNAIAIGSNVASRGDNTVAIGNTSITDNYIFGKLGVNIPLSYSDSGIIGPTPGSFLNAGAQIHAYASGTDTIMRLQSSDNPTMAFGAYDATKSYISSLVYAGLSTFNPAPLLLNPAGGNVVVGGVGTTISASLAVYGLATSTPGTIYVRDTGSFFGGSLWMASGTNGYTLGIQPGNGINLRLYDNTNFATRMAVEDGGLVVIGKWADVYNGQLTISNYYNQSSPILDLVDEEIAGGQHDQINFFTSAASAGDTLAGYIRSNSDDLYLGATSNLYLEGTSVDIASNYPSFSSTGDLVFTLRGDTDNDYSSNVIDLVFQSNGASDVGRIRWDEASSTLSLGYGANDHLRILSGGAIDIAGALTISGEGALNTDGAIISLGDGGHTHAEIYGVLVPNRNNTVTGGTVLIQGQWSASSTLPMIGANASGGGLVLGYGVRPKPASSNSFLSGHGYNLGRAAYILEGDDHTWYGAGAQTVTEGSDISLTKQLALQLDGSGNPIASLFNSAGNTKVRLSSGGDSFFDGGNVGIGTGATAGPENPLDLWGGSGGTFLAIRDNRSTTGDLAGIKFSTAAGTDYSSYKSFIAHIETGSNGLGDLIFCVDPDSTTSEATASDELLRISANSNVSVGYGVAPPNKLTVKHDEATNTWSSVSDASTDAVVKILGSNNATPYGLYLGYANSANNAQGIQAGDGTSALPLVLNPEGGDVGIGTASPNANAILDVSSTTKAFMPPRMTTTQKNAISSPTAGMVVYDSTLNKICVYTGAAWETVTSS